MENNSKKLDEQQIINAWNKSCDEVRAMSKEEIRSSLPCLTNEYHVKHAHYLIAFIELMWKTVRIYIEYGELYGQQFIAKTEYEFREVLNKGGWKEQERDKYYHQVKMYAEACVPIVIGLLEQGVGLVIEKNGMLI